MPTLTLKFKENTLNEYQLENGKSLTIGRLEGNDIVVENLAVSSHHAKVDSVGDKFLLTDLQSKNGSFVNNEPVSTHWLKHDDIITIGKHTLVFAYAEGESQPAGVGDDTMEHTMILDTNMYRDMLAKKGAKAAPQAKEKKQIGVLSFLSGSEGELELTKKLIKIGKNSSCDIVVSGLLVGQTAATISQRPNGYSLSYVEGMSKPKVNGKAVKESVLLNEFDEIEIGSVKMQFIYKN